jgi:hypothetical protein
MLIAVQAFRRLRQYTLIRISRRVWCSIFEFLTNTHHSVPWWRSLSGRTTITTTRRTRTSVVRSESILAFGLKSVAQGLPGFTLGCSPHRIGPEGAMRYGDNRLGTFEPDRVPGKGRWDSARFHPRTPTQAGSLCYIAPSVERFVEILPEGSSTRPPLPRDGVSDSIGFQPVSGSNGQYFGNNGSGCPPRNHLNSGRCV